MSENNKPFEQQMVERLIRIETKLDGYSGLKTKVYENERRIMLQENDMIDLKAEMKLQQEESRWLKRTVIATIITGVVGIGIAFMRVGIGI